MTAAQREKATDHYVAALVHHYGLAAGNRQPRYFVAARPGIEETRGVPFVPRSKRPRVLRPGKTKRHRRRKL